MGDETMTSYVVLSTDELDEIISMVKDLNITGAVAALMTWGYDAHDWALDAGYIDPDSAPIR